MTNEHHARLMARAAHLTDDSPPATVRSVRQEVVDDVAALTRILASRLRLAGVPTSRRRDEMMRPTSDTCDVDACPAGCVAHPSWRLSDSELAELVADGSLRLDDPRIAAGSQVAYRLRAATLEAARLERVLDPHHVTPLVIPENLDPSPCEVAVDPGIGPDAYALKYDSVIPSEEALIAIGALGPIVQVRAGTGYWAQLLRCRGTDVIAFDRQPSPLRNLSISRRWGSVRSASAYVASRHPDRTLLLTAPPRESSVAHRAVHAYEGDHVVCIGERPTGRTGDDSVHYLFRQGWNRVQELPLPQWGDAQSCLTVYRRRH